MMGLTYGVRDTQKMLNAFCELYDLERSAEAISELSEYPIEVVEKFLNAVIAIDEKLINAENMMGIIGYITIRINL